MPLEEVKRNIIGGKVKRISSSVQLALTRGYSAEEIINAMTESMLQVGALFHNNDIFVPEMLVAAATMKKGLALLRPLLSADRQTNHEKFILGTESLDNFDKFVDTMNQMNLKRAIEIENSALDRYNAR